MGRRKRDFNGRTKTEQIMHDPDRFSMLPEPLIIHILSMLEMQDAVKTGVLSKSWKNLWTHVHNIVLRRRVDNRNGEHMSYEQRMELRKMKDDRWISSVDHTLMQCIADIERFCLVCYCDLSAVIDKWIAYVLDKKVKILKLTNYCDAPDCLYQSSSITTLELCHVGFCLSSPINWSSLKSLLLDNVPMNDDFIEKILMGCPTLENLVLRNVFGIHHLNIMSPSVKRLKLCHLENERDIDILNIKAPWLQELKISGKFITTQCQLVDVSSLMKTTLTFHTHYPAVHMFDTEEEDWEYNNEVTQYNYRWIPMVTKLLSSLSYVGELIFGSEPIQVLSLSKVLGTPSPLFKCKHLSIETYMWKFDLPGIVYLLENAPHLETLFIKVLDDWQDAFPLYQTEILFQDGDPHLSMPNWKFLHLKNVKIDYWRYSCRDSTDHIHVEFFDFELVEYILRSAVVLDKLVLCSSRSRCGFHRCPVPNCSFQYVPRLSCKLISTFLSGNEAAEWEIKKSKNMFEFTFPNYASLHPTSSSSSSSPAP